MALTKLDTEMINGLDFGATKIYRATVPKRDEDGNLVPNETMPNPNTGEYQIWSYEGINFTIADAQFRKDLQNANIAEVRLDKVGEYWDFKGYTTMKQAVKAKTNTAALKRASSEDFLKEVDVFAGLDISLLSKSSVN